MDIGFALKKIIGTLIMPLPITLTLIVIGLYYLNKRNPIRAKVFSALGIALLLIFSTPIVSQYLIKPFEFSYPKLEIEQPGYLANLDVSYIIVFGCWHSDDPKLPLVAQIHQCSLPRVIQGVQIWRQIPEAKLVFSGNAGKEGKLSDPATNAKLAISLGVPDSKIVLIEGTADSQDEIVEHKKLVGVNNFIAISSATHIPRLDTLYNKHGMTPILSPAEYVSSEGDFSWDLLVPNSSALHQSERAIYELMGNIWVRLKSVMY